MAGLTNTDKNNNSKNIIKKKRANKKKRRTAVSSSEVSSSSSSSEGEDKEEDNTNLGANASGNEMEIEINADEHLEKENIPSLSSPVQQSKLIRDNIQLSDSDVKQEVLENQVLLSDLPVSDFINLHNIHTISDLKKVEQSINKKSSALKNPPIDNSLKNKFLTEIFKDYSDDIESLRQSNDFNKSHSLSLLANLLKEGASMYDKDTLESILQ